MHVWYCFNWPPLLLLSEPVGRPVVDTIGDDAIVLQCLAVDIVVSMYRRRMGFVSTR